MKTIAPRKKKFFPLRFPTAEEKRTNWAETIKQASKGNVRFARKCGFIL